MTNRTFLFVGGFLAVSSLVAVAPGCGDDDEDDAAATGTTQSTTTGTPGGTGGTGAQGGSGGSGGEATGGAGGTGGGMGGSGGGGNLTCAAYCATITANCADTNLQYASTADCEAVCATWDVGTAADMAGNTLGCHTYHAGAAMGMPDVHCIHAGPAGAGACGNNCDNFCELAAAACAGTFTDDADCQAQCGGFATDPPYVAQATGDNFACRMYHLTAAAAAPNPHCMHIDDQSPVCQ